MDNLTERKIALLEEPIMSYMFRKYPERFEKIEKMDMKTLLPKKIFKITHSFIFVKGDGRNREDSGDRGDGKKDEMTILPVRYLNYQNFENIFPCGGIIFPLEEKDSDAFENVWYRLDDILSKVYNVSNWMEIDNIEGEEELLRVIGTVWEERRGRFFPIVLDEGNNLMINVNIEDPKTKDLMNYKLKQIDTLKIEALRMKMPEKVEDLEDGTSSYKFLGSIDRKIAFDIPAERQDYTCFGCGYRPKNVDKKFNTYDLEEGRKLEPHRIVHHCFLGDYDRNNVVILCEKCHDLEYKYFLVHWNRFFEKGRLMEWNKLIEESFEFFKEYLVWLHLRK